MTRRDCRGDRRHVRRCRHRQGRSEGGSTSGRQTDRTSLQNLRCSRSSLSPCCGCSNHLTPGSLPPVPCAKRPLFQVAVVIPDTSPDSPGGANTGDLRRFPEGALAPGCLPTQLTAAITYVIHTQRCINPSNNGCANPGAPGKVVSGKTASVDRVHRRGDAPGCRISGSAAPAPSRIGRAATARRMRGNRVGNVRVSRVAPPALW